MIKFNLLSLIRKNIIKLNPYNSARNEYNNYDNENKKNNNIITFLDANENSFGSPLYKGNFYNRYPDPFQRKLKYKISKIKQISPSNIFLGNGSDEIIDLVYRIFSYPNIDNSIIFPPTYGMYEIIGKIHGIDIRKIPLNKKDYQIDLNKLENIIDIYSKIIFICSPNNPTGNDIKKELIINIINKFSGIVILDEAYIDFSNKESFSKKIENYPNLIVLQTLSKSWGLAGIRIGIGIASKEIINWMNKIKTPYNISEISQEIALNALKNKSLFLCNLKKIILERNYIINELGKISYINKIYPSSANFILIRVNNYSKKLYNYLVNKKIIVRDRSKITLCDHCLRITIGTRKENNSLIENIKNFFK